MEPVLQLALRRGDILIILDPGTTRSYSAYIMVTSEILSNQRERGFRMSDLIPHINFIEESEPISTFGRYPTTALYYEELSEPPQIGHWVSKKVGDRDLSFDISRYVPLWKLGYQASPTPVARQICQDLDNKAKKLGKNRRDFARDWAKEYFSTRVFPQLELDYGEGFVDRVIIGVCMPPEWWQSHADILSDLRPEGVEKHRMVAIPETEASFRAWNSAHAQRDEEISEDTIGNSIITVNVGGGTVDISSCVQTTARGEYRQTSRDLSDHCGSETISEAFALAMRRKIPPNFPNRELAIYRARVLFDLRCKARFGQRREKLDFMLSLSWISKEISSTDTRNETISFDEEELQSFFEPTLSAAKRGIKAHNEALGYPQSRGTVLLIGGGSENPYLKQQLHQYVKSRGLKIRGIAHNHQKEAILKGGIETLFNANEIKRLVLSRDSRAFIEYIKATGELKKKYPTADIYVDGNTEWILLARWFVKLGQPLHTSIVVDDENPRAETFPRERPLTLRLQIAIIDQHPGDVEYSAISTDGLLLTDRNHKVRARFEDVEWDLQHIPKALFQNVRRQNNGHKTVHRELEYYQRVIIEGPLVQYGIKIKPQNPKRPQRSRRSKKSKKSKNLQSLGLDEYVWTTGIETSRTDMQVSNFLDESYTHLPQSSGLISDEEDSESEEPTISNVDSYVSAEELVHSPEFTAGWKCDPGSTKEHHTRHSLDGLQSPHGVSAKSSMVLPRHPISFQPESLTAKDSPSSYISQPQRSFKTNETSQTNSPRTRLRDNVSIMEDNADNTEIREVSPVTDIYNDERDTITLASRSLLSSNGTVVAKNEPHEDYHTDSLQNCHPAPHPGFIAINKKGKTPTKSSTALSAESQQISGKPPSRNKRKRSS